MAYRLLKYGNRLITGQGGGVEFPHVRIGNLDWMTTNLTVDDGGEGIYKADDVTSPTGLNMGTQYYYTHAAAERVVAGIPGWRLPTKAECDALNVAIGGTTNAYKLKSISGWVPASGYTPGTDELGLNLYPAGFFRFQSSKPDSVGYLGYFFTSTWNDAGTKYWVYGAMSQSNNVQEFWFGLGRYEEQYGVYPIRLVRDPASLDERLLKKEV